VTQLATVACMREQLTHACYRSKVINLAKQGKKDLPGKAAAGGVGGGRLSVAFSSSFVSSCSPLVFPPLCGWGWRLPGLLRSVQLLQWRTTGCSQCGRAVGAGVATEWKRRRWRWWWRVARLLLLSPLFLFFYVFPSLSFLCCCFVLLLGNEGKDDGDGWGCLFSWDGRPRLVRWWFWSQAKEEKKSHGGLLWLFLVTGAEEEEKKARGRGQRQLV